MANFPFELDLPPGIFSDDTTFGAKGRWADGSNVRFVGGRPQKIGLCARMLGSSTTTPNPRALFAWMTTATAVPSVAVGADAALYCSGGSVSSMSDISPVGLGSSYTYWAFDSWGNQLMAAPKGGSLYTYTGSGVATIISQAPASMNHMIVTASRQVMALGCNEEISTTFNPMCIRWTDLEDYTNWTTTATNNAGEYILEGQGKIVAARRIGAYIAIWTNGMLFMATFIGDPSQTYRFEPVGDGCGLVSPGAVAELSGVLYWMSPDHRFFRWAPGSSPEQIPCPISRDLQYNVTAGATRLDVRTQAAEQPAFNEVWWFYPDTRDSASGGFRYVALNAAEGTWFRGQLDRRAVYHADFLFNPTGSSSVRGWRPFIGVDGDGKIYSHDVESFGGAGDGYAQIDSFIQSADQYIDSGQRRVMVTGINQDFEEQFEAISLTLYMRDRPQSTPVTKGPYSLATGTNKKDFRASGMIMSVKFSGVGTGGDQWRLGKPVFRCATQGGR